jgi:predicted dehydrogenase
MSDNDDDNDESKAGTRREFLKLAAATSVAAGMARRLDAQEADRCAKVSASDRVGLATIGLGGQGTADTRQALKVPGVELVAVADVYDGRLRRAREVFCDQLAVTRDYREVLARKDVDAVIIGTPDHWHSAIAIAAMQAGKDVYCEKPMVQRIEDGLGVVEAQKATGRILQVGSQRTSNVVYAKAKELLAAGAIGELGLVEAWWNRNSALGAWQYSIPPDASPATVDWDRFLGRAPKRPFEPIRLFRWRNYDDYGTGVAGDLFVHLFSGVHFITGSLGPTRVMATGGLRYWKDGRDAADVMLGLFDYPKTDRHPAFTLSLKVNFADGGGGGEEGFKFVGPEGAMSLGRDGITLSRAPRPKEPGYTIDTFPKDVQEAFLKEYRQKYPETAPEVQTARDERYQPPRNYSDHEAHLKNFIEAVRSRKPAVQDAVFGFRACAPALLSNVSYSEKRPVGWNPEAMKMEA